MNEPILERGKANLPIEIKKLSKTGICGMSDSWKKQNKLLKT